MVLNKFVPAELSETILRKQVSAIGSASTIISSKIIGSDIRHYPCSKTLLLLMLLIILYFENSK